MEEYKFNVTIKVDNPDEFIADDDDIGIIIQEGLQSWYPRLQVRAVDCEEVQQ